MPAEDGLVGDENIGKAVSVEIDEPKIGIRPVDVGGRAERAKGQPFVIPALKSALRLSAQAHEVDQSVAVDVLQLKAFGQCCCRSFVQDTNRAEMAHALGILTLRALVEPRTASLLGKDARQPFAI